MQTALDQITDWSDANFMEINTKKSKQMVFGLASSRNQYKPLVLRQDIIDTFHRLSSWESTSQVTSDGMII